MKKNLAVTKRQKQVLAQIERLSAKYSMPPTIRELMKPLGITPNGMRNHLLALKRKGLVTWVDNRSRTLRIVPQPSSRGMPLVTLEELPA